jgi:hypothetical protein
MAVPTPRDAPAVLAAYTRVLKPGQGALRLTNDQGRTAQNVPTCVACTASQDVGKAAQNGGSGSALIPSV